MTKTTRGLFAFVCLTAGTWASSAWAADECKPLPYKVDVKSTVAKDKADGIVETDFAKLVCKDTPDEDFEDRGLYYWNRFGFHKDEGWDRENYGFDDYCNPRKPLGRTFSAFFLIENSYTPKLKTWNDRSYIYLQDMYGLVAGSYNKLDDLRAGKCAGGTNGLYADFPFFEYIIMYQDAFERNIVFRASALIHEIWHYRTGYQHTCDDGSSDQNYFGDLYIPYGCQPNGVCAGATPNKNPKVRTVFAAQGSWAMDYHARANLNTSDTLKSYALKHAKTMLQDRICDQTSIPKGITDYLAANK